MRDKVKFRLRYASLNIFAYAHGVRRRNCGSAEDIIAPIYTTLVRNPTKWDFIRRRRISP